MLRRRGRFKQAAFLIIPPAMVISIEEAAFFTGWCSHRVYILDAGHVAPGASVYPDSIAGFNKVRDLHR